MFNKLNIDVCIPTVRGVPSQIIDEIKKETMGKIHISTTKPLVKARVELINKVETDLFLFLDDDIIYPPNLLSNLYSAMRDLNLPNNIGAVQGKTIPYGLGEKWDKALSDAVKFKGYKVMQYGERLMTSNMLMYTHLVKDWNPQKDVSGCEDLDLTMHIQEKHHSCVLLPIYVKHKRSWDNTYNHSLWYVRGYINVLSKNQGFKQFLKLGLGIGKYILLLPFKFRLSIYTIHHNFYICIAFIKVLLFE